MREISLTDKREVNAMLDLVKNESMRIDSKTTVEEKENFLEKENNIPMTVKIKKEVNDMCNLSYGIVEQTIDQMIDNMINTNLTDEQIIAVPGKSKDYIESRRKALKKRDLSLI